MKTLKIAAIVLGLASLAVSCIPEEKSMGDAGQTLVLLNPNGYTLTTLDPVATSQTKVLFDVRKNIPNAGALNKATTVVLKYDADTALLKAYNAEHGTTYIPLPPALGTVSPAISSGKITMEFGANEFAKTISIMVPNAFNFDFAKKYAVTFGVFSVSGEGKLSKGADSVVVAQVMAKNSYEGNYTASGWRDHPTLGVFVVSGTKYLYTVSQYTNETYTGDYTPYRLRVTIDPAAPVDKNVTIMSPDATLYNNTPAVNARGIPGGYNHYDPVEKKYYLYYYYNATAPRVIHEQFKKN